MDKETEKQIQELQILEQNLQNVLMQKQAFQLELNEVENASSELKSAKDEVYKIAGSIMIKTSKEDLEKELAEKKKLLELRLKSIDKQENLMSEKLNSLRQDIVGKISKKDSKKADK